MEAHNAKQNYSRTVEKAVAGDFDKLMNQVVQAVNKA